MVVAIYVLCMLTALACTVLLLRSYAVNGFRLLFWSGLCFAMLTLNNLLLIVDKVFFPHTIDLLALRLACGVVAVALLLYGLIWDES